MAGQPNQTFGKSKEDRVESVSDVGGLPEETVGKDVTSDQIRACHQPLCEEVGNNRWGDQYLVNGH